MKYDHTTNGISICRQDSDGTQIKIDPKKIIHMYNSDGDIVVMAEMKNGIIEEILIKRKGKWEILK